MKWNEMNWTEILVRKQRDEHGCPKLTDLEMQNLDIRVLERAVHEKLFPDQASVTWLLMRFIGKSSRVTAIIIIRRNQGKDEKTEKQTPTKTLLAKLIKIGQVLISRWWTKIRNNYWNKYSRRKFQKGRVNVGSIYCRPESPLVCADRGQIR
jgi:hypothetical protein